MSNNTLRKYADEGKIEAIRNPANQRLFNVDGYINGLSKPTRVVYARVSSRHQRDDLVRQKEQLEKFYPGCEVITDIGSGLNFKRKGLKTILERLMQGDKLEIVVAHKDRLTRFGFELIEYLAEFNGGRVMVHNDTTSSPEQELVSDLLSIITVFSASANGLRRYHSQVKEDKNLFDKQTGKASQ